MASSLEPVSGGHRNRWAAVLAEYERDALVLDAIADRQPA
jgi:hypothetical protein